MTSEDAFKEGVVDNRIILLNGKVRRLQAERDRLRKALQEIAKQNLESEMPDEDRENADYPTGYDCIVRVARAALLQEQNKP